MIQVHRIQDFYISAFQFLNRNFRDSVRLIVVFFFQTNSQEQLLQLVTATKLLERLVSNLTTPRSLNHRR